MKQRKTIQQTKYDFLKFNVIEGKSVPELINLLKKRHEMLIKEYSLGRDSSTSLYLFENKELGEGFGVHTERLETNDEFKARRSIEKESEKYRRIEEKESRLLEQYAKKIEQEALDDIVEVGEESDDGVSDSNLFNDDDVREVMAEAINKIQDIHNKKRGERKW